MATNTAPLTSAMASASLDPKPKNPSWLPPGADCAGDEPYFGENLEDHFYVPERLADKSSSLVEAVNDFHFAMLNDYDRNEFYRSALAKTLKPGDKVVEIGTGSGLLAMLAAKNGAEHVYAIEANKHLASLASHLMGVNGLGDKITVINKLSNHVKPGKDIPDKENKPNVLLSEILGTLLLGEGAVEFIGDARERLLAPDHKIIPAGGAQYIRLVESEEIKKITCVESWGDIDLRGFNALQDTVSIVFTKQYGFRFSSVDYKYLCAQTPVTEVDFYKDKYGSIPKEKKQRIKIEQSGTIHAILTYWEAWADPERTIVMSTDPEKTKDNFPRDMQWGQALQLVEDTGMEGPGPHPFVVEAGEELDLTVLATKDGAVLQFFLERVRDE